MARTIRSNGHAALCQALIAARRAAGLTQAELAQRLHCHQSLVVRIESGERRIDVVERRIDVVERVVLSRALERDACTLMRATEAATEADHRI